MENLSIQNNGNEMIFRLNPKGFDESYLISLIKRLQLEELAKKSGFSNKVLSVAESINKSWWKENGKAFLKNIKK